MVHTRPDKLSESNFSRLKITINVEKRSLVNDITHPEVSNRHQDPRLRAKESSGCRSYHRLGNYGPVTPGASGDL